MQEKGTQKKYPPNMMSLKTFERLKIELENAEEILRSSGKEIGEAAGGKHEWHDNAAYDQAIRETSVNAAFVAMLRNALMSPIFIEPRVVTEDVDMGNAVVVLFEGAEAPEEFTLLGPYDNHTNGSWISYMSPMGLRLIGLKRGQDIEYEIKGKYVRARVIDIKPGEF